MQKSLFGKKFEVNREGIFLLSLPLIAIAYQLIRPVKPFELIEASFLLFLVVPFLILRFILDENIYFLGFKKGKLVKGVLGIVLGWIIFFPVLNLLADQKEFQAIYPALPQMRQSAGNLLFWEIILMLPIFFAVQTFIFGYAHEGFRRIMGKSRAMLLLCFVAIPLFYLGRPPVEIILGSFAGLVACWIKDRSGSVLYPILFGWGLSVILDAIIVYKLYL
jgi:hypothetical protein